MGNGLGSAVVLFGPCATRRALRGLIALDFSVDAMISPGFFIHGDAIAIGTSAQGLWSGAGLASIMEWQTTLRMGG